MMKHDLLKSKPKHTATIALFGLLGSAMGFGQFAYGQETTADAVQTIEQGGGLKLPADLTQSGTSKLEVVEHRVGGRLERLTVTHSNGFKETFENPKPDSLWVTEDKELGETPNVRKWTIGSW